MAIFSCIASLSGASYIAFYYTSRHAITWNATIRPFVVTNTFRNSIKL